MTCDIFRKTHLRSDTFYRDLKTSEILQRKQDSFDVHKKLKETTSSNKI